MKIACLLVAVALSALAVLAAEPPPSDGAKTEWIAFPDPRLELCGLPWFQQNAPELWRLPKSAKGQIPPAVWTRGIAPDGGRIRFNTTSGQLRLRVEIVHAQQKLAYFDAYIDTELAGSAGSPGKRTAELVLFEGRGSAPKNVTVYLPNTTEVRVLAVGVDPGAAWRAAPPFAQRDPLMCYGSSVLQGTGAEHPGMTYPAVIARRLNLDFVNLGFGGAGKAEPAVVALVNQPPASGYLLDLGKSYGNQTSEPFERMLTELRTSHPAAPIYVVTPIYSTREPTDKAYAEKSVNLRTMMRAAAEARRAAGDGKIFVLEGLELFGPADKALFHDSQHPGDAGNQRLGERAAEIMRKTY